MIIFLLLSLLHIGHSQIVCPVQSSTPRDALGPFYLENSPLSAEIGPAVLLQQPENRLQVTGRVLSSRSKNDNCTTAVRAVRNVRIEVWYAGQPNAITGNYYQDDEYRGQVVTDDCGFYNFTQTFPALYPQRPILHTHLRLSSAANNQELLVTQMYFWGQEVGYVSSTSRALQAVDVQLDVASKRRSVEFDIFVDVDGNAEVCGGDDVGEDSGRGEEDPSDEITNDKEAVTQESSLASGRYAPAILALLVASVDLFARLD